MAERMIKFPSIEQYRHVVHKVTERAHYVGQDDNGNPVFDRTRPLPKLLFRGTVKIHGTNAAVMRDASGHVWTQSRENIITPTSDNAGFSIFAHGARDGFVALFNAMNEVKPISGGYVHAIFGEWCGKGIQKNVGIAQIPKTFVVFAMALVDEDGHREWLNPADVARVFCDAGTAVPSSVKHIYQFPAFYATIDFAAPEESSRTLSDITLAVEAECPVAVALGATADAGPLTGEGVVWQCTEPDWDSSGFWFKVKGEKHAPKTREPKQALASAEVERYNDIATLAASITPEWRLEQMYQQTFNVLNGGYPDIKRMGEYIKNVINDVLKEELDTISQNGITVKEISSPISKLAREYLMEYVQGTRS